jgi:hypothetical protein
MRMERERDRRADGQTERRTDGRTGGHDEANSFFFSQFCEKRLKFIQRSIRLYMMTQMHVYCRVTRDGRLNDSSSRKLHT